MVPTVSYDTVLCPTIQYIELKTCKAVVKNIFNFISFRATVVKEQDVFWTNVYSTFMRDLSKKESPSEYCATKTLIDPPHINTTPRPTRWPSTTEQLGQTTAVSGGNIWRSYSILWVVLFQLVLIF